MKNWADRVIILIVLTLILVAIVSIGSQLFQDHTPRGQLVAAVRWHSSEYQTDGNSVEVPDSLLSGGPRQKIRDFIAEQYSGRARIKHWLLNFAKDGKTIQGASVTVVTVGGSVETLSFPFPCLDEKQTKEFVDKAALGLKKKT